MTTASEQHTKLSCSKQPTPRAACNLISLSDSETYRSQYLSDDSIQLTDTTACSYAGSGQEGLRIAAAATKTPRALPDDVKSIEREIY